MNKRKYRIGINGFGRIGRSIFRSNITKDMFDIVVINDINPDSSNIAYQLNYDTLYDRLEKSYDAFDDKITCGEHEVSICHHNLIDNVDWDKYKVDVIIDASGVLENVKHSRNVFDKTKVKKIVVTHSPDNVDFTLILGVNEEKYNNSKHSLISSSICDATAIAPVFKKIDDEYGIVSGYVTTLHPWLNYQNLMDGPASSWSVPGQIYHHYALGRSAIGNMIPKPTSALDATFKVFENLDSTMIGSFSYRTPTTIVGTADITLNLKTSTTANEIKHLFEMSESQQEWKIFHNNLEPLVSLDFKKSEYSAIVDHRWTDIISGNVLKLVLWYDNEWGYSSRVVDQVAFILDKLGE